MENDLSTFALKRRPLSNNQITPFNSNFQGQRFGKNNNYQRRILLQDGLLQCRKIETCLQGDVFIPVKITMSINYCWKQLGVEANGVNICNNNPNQKLSNWEDWRHQWYKKLWRTFELEWTSDGFVLFLSSTQVFGEACLSCVMTSRPRIFSLTKFLPQIQIRNLKMPKWSDF